jgi:CxxC-x17-CxxC domain-containing protein
MDFQDRSIRCSECGTIFTLSAEKQQVSHSWGIEVDDKQCPSCIRSKTRYGTGGTAKVDRRQMFSTVCAECGKSTEVPFKPHSYRRVYCHDCYRKVGAYH